MPRFFVSPEQIGEKTVTFTGEDAHHISHSLRMTAGENVTVCDGQGNEYLCELINFSSDSVIAEILKRTESRTEPPYEAIVYQALPKGDKLDQVIQKSVECGACRIVPFESERCVVHMEIEKEEKKAERRNKIALEAAKQCGRGIIPTVSKTLSFEEAIRRAALSTLPLFCYEGEETIPLPQAVQECKRLHGGKISSVSVMVGSEGGFSPKEAEKAKKLGMIPVSLGKRILRTETAATFALSCMVYALEWAEDEKTDT